MTKITTETQKFNAYDYAYENYRETLNFMTILEIEEINNFDTASEVREYLSQFNERT